MQRPFSNFRNTDMCPQCTKIRKRKHLTVPALAYRTRGKGFSLALSTAIASDNVTAATRSNHDCAKPRQRAKQHVLCVRVRTSRSKHALAHVRKVRKARRVSRYANFSSAVGTAQGPRRACAMSSGDISFCVTVVMFVIWPCSCSSDTDTSSVFLPFHQTRIWVCGVGPRGRRASRTHRVPEATCLRSRH